MPALRPLRAAATLCEPKLAPCVALPVSPGSAARGLLSWTGCSEELPALVDRAEALSSTRARVVGSRPRPSPRLTSVVPKNLVVLLVVAGPAFPPVP